jgi:hypothetical protein
VAYVPSYTEIVSRPGSAVSRLVAGVLFSVMAAPLTASEPNGTLTTASCCNVIELRQYTLHPGRREPFIELFDSTFADPLDGTGMTVIGQFRDLDRPDRFVWIRGFQDMPSRAKELAAFYDSDLWHAHRNEANASIDDSDSVLLLEPAAAELRFQSVPPRSAPTGVAPSSGLFVATLYYTKADSPSEFAELFEHSLRRHAEKAGARTLAGYLTSPQDNNFPRLPVRVGERIFVWMAHFTSPEAYAAYQVKLTADKTWTQTLWAAARQQLSRDPEVLRLIPTARSRLRG